MTAVVLIQAQPRLAATGGVITLRLAGGGSRPYDQLGVTDWRAGVANIPRLTSAVGFDQTGVTGGALPQTGGIRFFPTDKALLSAVGNVHWLGARIVVSVGDDEDAAPVYPTSLAGTVSAIKTDGGALTLTLSDLSVDLNKPVAPDAFAGTGDLEGVEEATGRIKRRTWGRVFNVEGRVLDKANNIWEFGDPNRQLAGFDLVKDKGVGYIATTTVAWQGSALATLNTLRATTPPTNGVVTAPSIACVKPWTRPAGPITADFRGETTPSYVETAPELAARIVSIYSTDITIGNLAEALAYQSAPVGIHAAETNETVAQVLDRLLLPVSIIWALDGAGVLTFRRLTWSGPVEVLTADTISRETTYDPLRTRRVGYQRNHREHSDAEISAALLLATDVTYVDGTSIEALKPAVKNADVTGQNTAAAILGQGPGATATGDKVLNSAVTIGGNGQLIGAGGGQVSLNGLGAKALALLDSVAFGVGNILESIGGPFASLGNFKTQLGQAASILGQGLFATQNNANLDDASLFSQPSRFLASAFGAQYFKATAVAFTAGLTIEDLRPGELGSNKTETRTAAAILGQTAFATAPQLGRDNLFGTYFNINAFSLNYSIRREDGTSIVTESLAITSLGISAAVVGQGSLATQNTVTGGQVVNGVIQNADGSVAWNLGSSLGRMDRTRNGYRFSEGAGFGSNGDLLLWFGSTDVGAGAETKANCTFAIATDGTITQNIAPVGAGAATGGATGIKVAGTASINNSGSQTPINAPFSTQAGGYLRLSLAAINPQVQNPNGGGNGIIQIVVFVVVNGSNTEIFRGSLFIGTDGTFDAGALDAAIASPINNPVSGSSAFIVTTNRIGGAGSPTVSATLQYVLERA